MTRRWLVPFMFTLFMATPVSAALTITGTFQRTYQAQNCGQRSGCTCSEQTLTAPVRHATVEIVNTSNTLLATTSTNASGAFSVSVSSLSTGSAFTVKLWAETAAAVIHPSGSTARIGAQWVFPAQSSPNVGTITINAAVDVPVPNLRPALHVMDNAIKAYQYAANRGLSMSQVVIDINAPGTDYNSGNNLIRMGSANLWLDAMIHEYGHYIDDSLSPFRGVAYIGSQIHTVCQQFDSAPEGVFAEGWGNYIVAAVTARVYYTGFWCSIDTGGCTEKSRNIEGSVAAVLWDLHDSANETFDVIANEHQKVWNVMDGFNFTNPSLETFMADYNDSRANAIECQYTGQKCETIKPVVSSFSVSPTTVTSGNSITASWVVSDSGGSGLNTVELWRTPDSGGAPNASSWAKIKSTTLSGNGPTSGSFSDTPSLGSFWYGIHVTDQALNLGLEPSPPGPIKVTVGAQACSYSIGSTSRSVSSSSGSGTVQVTGSPSGCTGSWSSFISSGGTFLSLTGTSSGSGSGTWSVPYSYSQNTLLASRQGTIAFSGSFPAGGMFTLTQDAAAPPQCSFSITPQSTSGAGAGGSGSIQVSGSPANCIGSWSASSATAFLSLTGTASGNGPGTWQVPYSYTANPSSSSTRQGQLVFSGSFPGGGTFTLTQQPSTQPACSFSITPQIASGAGPGGSGAVQVTGAPSGCGGSWSASSVAAFITLSGTSSGSGAGTWQVPFSYSQNPSTSSSRQGSIVFSGSFPSGGTFTLTQESMSPTACSFAISPQSASGAGGGGNGSVQVTGSPAGCTGSWSASSTTGFLSLTGTASGSGSGTWQVPYSYSINPSTSSARQGSVVFSGAFPGGGTFTLTQQPSSQSACSYAISPQSASGSAAGGSGSIEVTGSPGGCVGNWSAFANAAFITLTGTAGGGGSGTWQLPYSYSQNPSTTSTRQGSIVFSGTFPTGGTFTLTQQPLPNTSLPNLTPLKVTAWSDMLVVSKVPETTTDDVLQPGDTLYIDWAVINGGSASTQGIFYIDLMIDGQVAASWYADSSLDPNWYLYVNDWAGPSLTPGRHTVTILADSTNAVAESDESDNQYTRTIVVGPTVIADVNGDGRSDILWRNRYTGMTLVWSMPADGVLQTLSPYPRQSGTDYELAGVGELGGAFPTADLLWRRSSTHQLSTQYMAGGAPLSEVVWPSTPAANLAVAGLADLDGNGLAETILRNTQTGETSYWAMTAAGGVQKASIHPGGNLTWNIVAVRDFDGDTRADILWRDSGTGMTLVWFMSGASIRSSQVVHQGGNTDWTIAGIGDFDGDSKSDLFWRQPSSGMTILWLMNGAGIRSSTLVHPGGNQAWSIAGLGDFGGDGRADVLWRENSTGQTLYWSMTGAVISKSVPLHGGGNLDWDIVAPKF